MSNARATISEVGVGVAVATTVITVAVSTVPTITTFATSMVSAIPAAATGTLPSAAGMGTGTGAGGGGGDTSATDMLDLLQFCALMSQMSGMAEVPVMDGVRSIGERFLVVSFIGETPVPALNRLLAQMRTQQRRRLSDSHQYVRDTFNMDAVDLFCAAWGLLVLILVAVWVLAAVITGLLAARNACSHKAHGSSVDGGLHFGISMSLKALRCVLLVIVAAR